MATTEQLIRFETNDGYSAVVFQDDFKEVDWSEIEKAGNDLVEQVNAAKPKNLLIDLSHLKYMGSSMVTVLVRLWKSAQQNGGKMVVVTCEPVVLEILKIAKLTDIWTIAGTRESGLQKLGLRVEKRGARIATLLGLLLAAAALVAFGLALSPGLVGGDPHVSVYVQIGCAALGLLVGLIALFRGSGFRRVLAVVVVLVCLAVGGVGVANLADVM